jgi:hypothetical protein
MPNEKSPSQIAELAFLAGFLVGERTMQKYGAANSTRPNGIDLFKDWWNNRLKDEQMSNDETENPNAIPVSPGIAETAFLAGYIRGERDTLHYGPPKGGDRPDAITRFKEWWNNKLQ